MVRPKEKEPKEQCTVMLKPSLIKRIDRLAELTELSRSQMMSNLIDIGLDEADVLEKMGILSLIKLGVKGIREMKKKLIRKETC